MDSFWSGFEKRAGIASKLKQIFVRKKDVPPSLWAKIKSSPSVKMIGGGALLGTGVGAVAGASYIPIAKGRDSTLKENTYQKGDFARMVATGAVAGTGMGALARALKAVK